jgi:hypothetical protein
VAPAFLPRFVSLGTLHCEIKYIGMDVRKEAIVIAVLNSSGEVVMESLASIFTAFASSFP